MITIDVETKSEADLPKVGAWAYSEHPTTDAICVAYGIGDGPIQTWWPGKGDKYIHDLFLHIEKSHCVEAHNVAFERSIWQNVMTPRYGWPVVPEECWRDTMAVAQYLALPAALAKLSDVLGLGTKDPEGGRLITKYSKLNLKTSKRDIPNHEWIEWKKMTATERKANPEAKDNGGYFNEDFQKFVAYCVQDVELERKVSHRLGALSDAELAVFQLDQRINMRGLHLDLDGIATARAIVTERAGELTVEFRELTGFGPIQTAKVKDWFGEQGVELDNLQADYLQERYDEGDIPGGPAERALEIRLKINKASTKKLDAMERQSGIDNRARFQTRYHGAVTGRWTGSGFQPLNLNRGYEGVAPEQLVRDIAHGSGSWLDLVYGDAMDAVARASRHWITAAPGNKIMAGDFTSIEAVILACLAGEEWKVKAFREGVKIYEFMADKIHGLPNGTVTKETHPAERQDGKTGELAFGYQGALGAWLKFDSSGTHSDARIIEICKAWRAQHPQIVNLWKGLNDAALKAYRTKELATYRSVGFEMVKEWLTMILPNGKRLWYWEPRVETTKNRWCDPEGNYLCRKGTCGHEPQQNLTYMAMKEGRWQRVHTYGGKLAENLCQAVSREILVPAMMRAEVAGYPVILSVYDEIVAEVPEDFGSLEEFLGIMSGPLPEWATTWPIGVDGWEGQRYRK